MIERGLASTTAAFSCKHSRTDSSYSLINVQGSQKYSERTFSILFSLPPLIQTLFLGPGQWLLRRWYCVSHIFTSILEHGCYGFPILLGFQRWSLIWNPVNSTHGHELSYYFDLTFQGDRYSGRKDLGSGTKLERVLRNTNVNWLARLFVSNSNTAEADGPIISKLFLGALSLRRKLRTTASSPYRESKSINISNVRRATYSSLIINKISSRSSLSFECTMYT